MDYYTTTGNDYSTVGSAFGAAAGVALGFVIISIAIAIGMVVIYIIGMYKLLKKCGKSPVGAFIPFIGQYELMQASGVNVWWLVIFAYSGIVLLVPVLGVLAYIAMAIYYAILYSKSLAQSFGKDSIGFVIGLVLLHPIFVCVLGFGKSVYVGAKPMNDIIFKNYKPDNNTNQQTNNTVNPVVNNNVSTESTASSESVQPETKFCPNCGATVEQGTKFCSSCGGEIK